MQIPSRWPSDICVVSEGCSNPYQVFLQVDAAQEAESLKARQTGDSVRRQVENLQTLEVRQPFNGLQLVPTLDTDRREDVFKAART